MNNPLNIPPVPAHLVRELPKPIPTTPPKPVNDFWLGECCWCFQEVGFDHLCDEYKSAMLTSEELGW